MIIFLFIRSILLIGFTYFGYPFSLLLGGFLGNKYSFVDYIQKQGRLWASAGVVGSRLWND